MKDLWLPQHTRHDLVCKQQLSRKQSSSKVFGCFRERSRAKNTEIGEQFLAIQKRSKTVGQTLWSLVLHRAQQKVPRRGFSGSWRARAPQRSRFHRQTHKSGSYELQRRVWFTPKFTKEHKGLQWVWSLCSVEFCSHFSAFPLQTRFAFKHRGNSIFPFPTSESKPWMFKNISICSGP